MASKAETLTAPAAGVQDREQIFDTFRRWGYLQASLDPLGQYLPPEPFPIATTPEGDIAAEARSYYCGNFAVEFMHIPNLEQRQWLQDQIERPAPKQDQAHILTQLIRADLFEQVIQQRYLGTKRFSLEGLTVLIPFLDQVFSTASAAGVTRSIIAMAHRGRLNVMTNTIGRSPSEIFAKFEDVDPRSVLGGGDVKYHMGATGEYTSPGGKTVALHLASNPSHLEAVNPVVMGRARAWQIRIGEEGKQQVLPIILHGDAAFAGQGITAESLNFAALTGYSIGGTMHIITNNLLGFTANPEESNSTRFSTDLAKRLPIPIFHANGEDPDTAMRIAAIAAEYRQRFHSDVVVDLIGYRRYGHNETDDATVTQPRRYAAIKERPFLYQTYAKSVGVDPASEAKAIQEKFLADQTTATKSKRPKLSRLPEYWKPYHGGELTEADANLRTGLSAERVLELSRLATNYPPGFHIHPKVQKLYEQRIEMAEGKRLFDYGAAELLAYASLLTEGTPVRLAGQDSQRGTFNQRHSVLVDMETEVRYTPLDHMSDKQARFEVHNSLLSEAAALGFEYGYARDYPEALVLWEAQFGDFVNGAQSIIDQFIAAGEAKWGLLSGVVMLLPHGYDGQGPEHSSARMERFLQLAASENMVIAQPSNASQYFHLLRRQALRSWRKPLVVFTPKSMLRHPDASSPVSEFAKPAFENVLPDNDVTNPRRLLVCTGKIGHNLRVERAKRKDMSVGIIFIEQLYPWPEAELQAALDQHPNAPDIVWVQEEPANMGAFSYVMPELRRMAGNRTVLSVKRSANASPATGSAKAHEIEEKTLIDLALGSAV
ncbi:MAG TPA: 2-oxoglutarate dehydrogenase E1 component [Edaphobacter sp.]|jgi:2-oxoglutarate dehydrogenase E1 component|nr:2-oxoglutarate dehydrogenase E1 component [Edaphobacter sp.]